MLSLNIFFKSGDFSTLNSCTVQYNSHWPCVVIERLTQAGPIWDVL